MTNPRYVGHNWNGWRRLGRPAPPPACAGCGHPKNEHVNGECHGSLECPCRKYVRPGELARAWFLGTRVRLSAALAAAEGGTHVFIPDHVDPTTGGRYTEYARVVRALEYLRGRAERGA